MPQTVEHIPYSRIQRATRRSLTAPARPRATPPPTLPERLDAARRELAAAGDDFQRLKIRDGAAAIRAAAEVLKRRDVQVAASELVADAERAIAQANPPMPRAEAGRKGGQAVAPGATASGPVLAAVPRDVLAKMRRAHAMPDSEYERVKERHRATGQPLTRSALLERRRATSSRDSRPAGRREPARRTSPAAPSVEGSEIRTKLEAAHTMLRGARDACDPARALGVVGRAAALVGEAMALLEAAAPATRPGR